MIPSSTFEKNQSICSTILRALAQFFRSPVHPGAARRPYEEFLWTDLSGEIENTAGLGRAIEDIEEDRQWKPGFTG
jgi:hypothetical protein